jgi:hypothetical protein
MRTCGATPGGPDISGIDLTTQTVIQGVIFRDGKDDGVPNGTPVGNAYVRLLDSTGEFTAEVPTNADGQFRFFAAPGIWTLVILTAGAREERNVTAIKGVPVDLVLHI